MHDDDANSLEAGIQIKKRLTVIQISNSVY